MFPIDTPSATPDKKFTEGSPTGGVPATVVSATWLNDLQAELLAILSAAGVTPSKAQQNQVLKSLAGALKAQPEFASQNGPNGYQILPSGQIRQYGVATITGGAAASIITMPIPFKTAGRGMQILWRQNAQSTDVPLFMGTFTGLDKFSAFSSKTAGSFSVYWEAVGE